MATAEGGQVEGKMIRSYTLKHKRAAARMVDRLS